MTNSQGVELPNTDPVTDVIQIIQQPLQFANMGVTTICTTSASLGSTLNVEIFDINNIRIGKTSYHLVADVKTGADCLPRSGFRLYNIVPTLLEDSAPQKRCIKSREDVISKSIPLNDIVPTVHECKLNGQSAYVAEQDWKGTVISTDSQCPQQISMGSRITYLSLCQAPKLEDCLK
ncbi:hypothetical protein RF11_15983 [Thelohanellus kitauei]|uniref:Uncharacterized protein n=1 Tax=Thelohanellus kitauei TaxID=669202 RepID=A0A0C2IM78_THEKT|nr:hypothetical protein RF11_15983 [Thelohanellus kitauei]